MIIKLLSTQVPQFWEAIKFVVKTVDEVDEQDMPAYLNDLLQSLLSDKAQCFVGLDENRKLVELAITKILMDKVLDEKYLSIQTIYAWQKLPVESWAEGFELVAKLARKEHCKYISFRSRNPRVWEMASSVGFREKYRIYQHPV